jgi:hypothetical protein
VAAAEHDRLTHMLGLHASPTGRVVLRATRFDFNQVQHRAGLRAVAALDAATSTDPRAQGAGRAALSAELACYQACLLSSVGAKLVLGPPPRRIQLLSCALDSPR